MISFDDLVSKQFLGKTKITVQGVGDVEVHRISATKAVEITRGMEGLEKDELETYISAQALEFVKGEKVTDKDVESFRQNVTAQAISDLFTKGLASKEDLDLEDAEKN